MGPFLAVHVVNTAMRIMLGRYPEKPVRWPLPEQYDLRKVLPISLSDQEYETAKAIFNQRTASDTDLDQEDITAALEPLDSYGQTQVFIALFMIYGNKLGALKYHTGIQ
jgi:hypothetical protein